MPWKEATFWIGLTAFGTGLSFVIDYFVSERASKRLFWMASMIGLVGASAAAYSMYSYYVPTVPKPPVWLYTLVLTWGLIGWDIYDRRSMPRGKSTPPLRIISAKYGVGGDRYIDVTAQIKAQVKNNKLNFLVSNVTLLGLADPFYGEVKYLILEYSFGNGPVREITRREQDRLEIPEEGDSPLQQVEPSETSLEQRSFDAAKNLRKQWTQFKKKIGDKPDYAGPTLGQGRVEASAEYLKQSLAWQDRARGWYEGRVKEGLVKIRSELAEHGLIDQQLDDQIGLRHPTDESIQIICQRLKWLACQIDD